MKKLLLVLLIPISNCLVAQVTYVNYFDAIYPIPTSGITQSNIDINNDGIPDYVVSSYDNLSQRFDVFGNNKLNGQSSPFVGFDCTNDTLNALDLWSNTSILHSRCFCRRQFDQSLPH